MDFSPRGDSAASLKRVACEHQTVAVSGSVRLSQHVLKRGPVQDKALVYRRYVAIYP